MDTFVEILIELIVHNRDMPFKEFCLKFKLEEDYVKSFWRGELAFPNQEDLKWWRMNVRKTMKKYQADWKSKGFTPQDLLDFACSKLGVSHELWQTKHWVSFDLGISGDGHVLEGIETSRG